MPLVTCPDCSKQISDQALACPNCGRPIAPPPVIPAAPAKKKSGCRNALLIVLAVVVVLFIIGLVGSTSERSSSHPASTGAGEWKTDAQGHKYFAVPEITTVPVEDVTHVIRVREVLAAQGNQIKTVLTKQLGPGPTVKHTHSLGEWHWEATKAGFTVEVWPDDKGKVLCVLTRFKPPARDWAAAIAMVGLDPNVSPTKNLIGVQVWEHAFRDIDEVLGFRADAGKPEIKQLTITPDKQASDQWDKRP